ncbi:MAG TPA: TRAM domain-containing protein [Natrialbaceae archaeon]|nr:TRAM domain-containing protein [Natrialbaceae archaeon]
MVEIPDTLRSVFSATVRERDGKYVVEIPASEIEHEAVDVGGSYRVAILEQAEPTTEVETEAPSQSPTPRNEDRDGPPQPPVEEGEIRDVTIETVGDQGDGIAKVERGYVVIVPGAGPGDEPTVEIETVRQNVGFASVVEDDSRRV